MPPLGVVGAKQVATRKVNSDLSRRIQVLLYAFNGQMVVCRFRLIPKTLSSPSCKVFPANMIKQKTIIIWKT